MLICLTCYRVGYLVEICKTNFKRDHTWRRNYMDEYEDVIEHRLRIFLTASCILIDFPSFILMIIVFGTIWRAFELWHCLRYKTDTDDPWKKSKMVFWHCWTQFWSLIRDIFFFIPFLIIMVTLFRALGLMLKLYAKCKRPQTTSAELTVNAATMEFPEKGKVWKWDEMIMMIMIMI